MTERPDVVVIGGGIAGATVAYHLVAAGAQTTIVDRRDPGRATDAGAGILSPETTHDAGSSWSALALASGRYYGELAAALRADGEEDLGFDTTGLLAVALADWDVEAYEHAKAVAVERSRGGIVEISGDEARAKFPALGPVTRALWNPGAARVDGRRFTAAVLRSAVGHGLDHLEGSVDRLVVDAGKVVAVEVDGRTLGCGAVVVAGGAWSPALAGQLDVVLPVGPERGQIVHLHAAHLDTDAWPIVSPVLGHYVVPWPGGRAVVGATREAGAGFAAEPTVAGVRQVLNEVARVVPGLLDATLVEIRVGLRPACADGLPVLGALPGVANAYVATGYGADGLLLSPWCGKLVASWVLGATPDPTVEAFSASRFIVRPVSG
jgi:D-amino-acid dehydrogenase